jgi:hypothetical protein
MDDVAGSLEPLLDLAERMGPAEKAPAGASRGAKGDGAGRRVSSMPLIEIARTKTKPEALEALSRWQERHADIVGRLEPADILLDGMRGRSSVWYRVRVNLQHVPEAQRPEQEVLEADYNPWAGVTWPGASREPDAGRPDGPAS